MGKAEGSQELNRKLQEQPGTKMPCESGTTQAGEMSIETQGGMEINLSVDAHGQQFLCIKVEEDDDTARWAMIPVSPDRMTRLLQGISTTRSAASNADFIMVQDRDKGREDRVRTTLSSAGRGEGHEVLAELLADIPARLEVGQEIEEHWTEKVQESLRGIPW